MGGPTKLHGFLIRLPVPLHKKLKARAKKENRTLNNLIMTVLLEVVK